MPWGVPTGEVNGEDLPQTKDVDNGVRQGDPHASSKASLTRSSAECAEVKKIVSESCGQVNVAAAESVKENSPDVSSVPHETQEELQKPRVKLLRLPAEGKQEAAEIIGMAGVLAECSSYQWKLRTLLNEMAMLDGKQAMRVCGADKGDDSIRKTAETPARAST